MKLSIIIPTKDRGDIFLQTLQHAVESIKHLDAEVLIVNDSKTTKINLPAKNNVRILDNPKTGVAAARNFGVKESSGELLLFLDDDILISKKSIDHVLMLHDQIQDACFNLNWNYPPALNASLEKSQFGRFMKAHQLTYFKGWYNDITWKDEALFKSKSVASFHLSILRKDFQKTKGYNEQFPHAGFEDYDFPLQLARAGISFYIDSRVTVHHNEADRSNLQNWLNSQQRRAATRKVAVGIGYTELQLEFGSIKKVLLKTINLLHDGILVLLAITPNYKPLDFIYFRLVAALQAGKIFKGYTSI